MNWANETLPQKEKGYEAVDYFDRNLDLIWVLLLSVSAVLDEVLDTWIKADR